MILVGGDDKRGITRVPRVGGGDPEGFAKGINEFGCSPRRRG